jgi:hypothetical protein
MGRRERPQGSRGALILVLALTHVVRADPLVLPPIIGDAHWGGTDKDAALIGFVADARMVGVIEGDRLAIWPDRTFGLEPGEPALLAFRPGAIVHLRHAPLSFVLRADLGEPERPFLSPPIGAKLDAVLDDLYALWRPIPEVQLLVGRAQVPWSKYRQWDVIDDPIGAPPFLTDRIAPDRRWGATVFGDLGAGAYAAGVYEDVDALEPRARTPFAPGDPSTNARLDAMAQLEWTPVAPMMGSNPVGKIIGARGPLPTPRADPWFDTARVSLGLGVLYRNRPGEAGGDRVDVCFSAQFKLAWFGALAEFFAPRSGYAQLFVTPIDKLDAAVSGEWDDAAQTWTALGSIGWSVTKNRRNRVVLDGWLRRDTQRGTPYDALVVFLQASL